MELKKKIKDNIGVIILSSLFLIFLLVQHQFLFMYHDDYGYASLSYAYVVDGVNGTNYSFPQIWEFITGHYNIWGGRVLTFLFEILLFRYTGLAGYRIMQALAIFIIFFLIYKILEQVFKHKIANWKLALVSFSLYGLIEIATFKEGIFWISASVSYVVPIVFLLLFIYLYCFKFNQEGISRLKKTLYLIIMIISIFCAGFSQEQVGVASVMFIAIYTVYNYVRTRKINWYDLTFLVVGIIGFLILMLAPGNEVRQQHPTSIGFYQQPLIERMFTGIQATIEGNFSSDNKLFGFFFFTISIIVTVYNVVKEKGCKFLNYIALISIFLIFIITVIQSEGYFVYINSIFANHKIISYIVIVILLLQLCLFAYSITIYLLNEKMYFLIIIFYCAVISQVVMIIAPYFSLRCTIIFEFLFILIGIKILGDMYINQKFSKVIMCFVIAIIIVCGINAAKITYGYYSNYQINKQNDQILREVSQRIKNGEVVKEVELKKLPKDGYSASQPYQEGLEYIRYYIGEYYDLPEELVIVYV